MNIIIDTHIFLWAVSAPHNKDPFDRMLISQSINRKFKIMSDDSKFRAYGCELI